MYEDLRFPERGLDESGPRAQQAPGTTVDCLNVRIKEPVTGRLRGGSRAGIAKFISGRGAADPVQNLGIVVHTDDEALTGSADMWASLDDGGLGYVVGDDFVTDPVTGRNVPPGGTGYLIPPPTKKTPLITWADPAEIFAGTALSSTQLNATATDPDDGSTVAGTFTYSPASGQVLLAGNDQTLHVLFVPTDTTTYYAAADEAVIDVLPLGNFNLILDNLPNPYQTANWILQASGLVVTGGTGVTASADVQAATWSLNSPTITTAVNVNVSVSAQTATWSLNSPTGPTFQTPTLVQTGSGTSGAADTTVDGTWTGATTAGNFLVAVVAVSHNAAITSITPPSGWTEAKFVANGALAFRACGIYYKENAASESTTGDFTASGASSGCVVVMAEFSGVTQGAATAPEDQDASSFTDVNSGTFNSGTTGTTTVTDELLIAGYATGSGAHNNDPTNSFSIAIQAENSGAGGIARATMTYRVVTSVGTYSSAITGTSQKWAACIQTFKAKLV